MYQYFKNRFQCVTLITCYYITGSNARFCYTCLNIDCQDGSLQCDQMRKQIISEIKHLYYLKDNRLPPCPGLNESYAWRNLQLTDKPCPESDTYMPACAQGRMLITTRGMAPDGSIKTVYNQATVMGCAKVELVSAIATSSREQRSCYHSKENRTDANTARSYDLENCPDAATLCSNKDYCVNWTRSEISPWPNTEDAPNTLLKMGILAGIGVIIIGVLLAGVFFMPGKGERKASLSVENPVEVNEVADNPVETDTIDNQNLATTSHTNTAQITNGSIRQPSNIFLDPVELTKFSITPKLAAKNST